MDKSKMIVVVIGIVILLALGIGVSSMNKNATSPTPSDTVMMSTPPVDMNTPMMASDSSMMASNSAMMGNVKEITVEGSNFKFMPASITVKKGDTVKVTFKNTGGMHDFVIDEFKAKTKQIQGGSSDTVTFVADKAGTFDYYCSVGQHRQMGMVGKLIVQ